MLINLFKKIFTFGIIFTLVVIGLYMDRFIAVKKLAFKEIFSVGFPWNLIVFTVIIYFCISTISLFYRKILKIR